MGKSLFQELGGRSQPQQNDGGFSAMMQEFNRFRSAFQGNAKAEVQKLISSGQMSQSQFNQLSQMANQIAGFLPHR